MVSTPWSQRPSECKIRQTDRRRVKEIVVWLQRLVKSSRRRSERGEKTRFTTRTRTFARTSTNTMRTERRSTDHRMSVVDYHISFITSLYPTLFSTPLAVYGSSYNAYAYPCKHRGHGTWCHWCQIVSRALTNKFLAIHPHVTVLSSQILECVKRWNYYSNAKQSMDWTQACSPVGWIGADDVIN